MKTQEEQLVVSFLASGYSQLSDEALDAMAKNVCGRRRRDRGTLAWLVYEKNLRLAKAGCESEFAAWYSQPGIELKKEKVYRLIREHAQKYDLPFPWQLKKANGTESYHSTAVFEVNPLFATTVSDPSSEAIKGAKADEEEERQGRDFSTIARLDLEFESPQMRKEVKFLASQIGLRRLAPYVYTLLRNMRQSLLLGRELKPSSHSRSCQCVACAYGFRQVVGKRVVSKKGDAR